MAMTRFQCNTWVRIALEVWDVKNVNKSDEGQKLRVFLILPFISLLGTK
jgi:hypothetical protein